MNAVVTAEAAARMLQPGAIVASLAAVLLGWSVLQALRDLGVNGWPGTLLTAAVLLHPLMLYAIATGAGAVLGAALLVLSVRLVLAWAHDERNSLSLIGGAFAVGLATLASYEVGAAAGGLTLAVALLAGRQPGQRLAYAIAFGTPPVGVMGLWLVVSWLAIGNPLAVVAQNVPASYHLGNSHALSQFVAMAPLMLVALPGAGVLLVRAGQQARAALVLSLSGLAIAGCIALEALMSGSAPLRSVLPLAPLSVLLLAEVAQPVEAHRWRMLVVLAALACVLVPLASMDGVGTR